MKHKFYPLIALFVLLFSSASFAQNVNINNSGGEFADLRGGETDQVVFAFTVDRDGGSQSVTDVTVTITGSITNALTNLRLFTSSNATFDGGDTERGTFSFESGSEYSVPAFTAVSLPSDAGDLVFFVVADVHPQIQTTASFQFSISASQLASSGTEGGSATSPSWNSANIVQLTATLSEEENSVATSGLAGTTDIPLMGFQFASNGGGGFQEISSVTFSLNTNTTSKFTNFRLVESTNDTYNGGEPTVGTAMVTAGSPSTVAVTGLSADDDKWYFLLADTDPNAADEAVTITLSAATADLGYTGGTGFTQVYTINGREATLAEQTGGVPASAIGGTANVALIGFNFSTNASQTLSAVNYSLDINTTGVLSNFELIESATATYTGAGTPAGSVMVTPGATTTVAVSSLTAAADKYYFLIADLSTSAANGTITTTLTSATASTGSAPGTPFSQALTVDQLEADLAEQTGGVPATLVGGNIAQALIGFNFASNGTQNITAVDYSLDINTTGVLSNFKVTESTTASYTGTGATVGSAIVTPGTPTTIAVTGLTATSTNYYFLVADVASNVADGTVITTSLTASTASAGFTSGTFNQAATTDALEATLTEQTGGVPATLVGDNTSALIGLSFSSNGTQTLSTADFSIDINTTGILSGFQLIESTTATYTGTGTPVGSVVATPGATTTVAVTGLTASATNYYFLVATVATGISDGTTITTTFTGATATPGAVVATTFSQAATTDALEATLAEQTGGVPATVVGGSNDAALIGFNFTSNGTQTIATVNYSLDINTTGVLSGFQLIESATATYTGAGTPVGSVLVTPGATTTVAVTGLTASATNYYFLVADLASNVPDGNTINTTLTGATAATGVVASATFSQGMTTEALEATLTEQTGGVSSTLLGGSNNLALIGFNFATNGSQTIATLDYSLDLNTTGVLSGFQVIESATASYTGAGTPVGSVMVTPGATTTIAVTGLTASATSYYFLIADVAGGVADGTVITTTLTGATANQGADLGAPFSQAATTDALEATLTEQTGGVSSTLLGGTNNAALIGFNFTTNGSQTIASVNYSLNINTTGSLSGFQVIESATASYTGAGTPVGSVLVTPGATTTIAVTGLTANTTSYYFLIADVSGSVADAVSITTTLSSAAANQGSVLGTPFNQAATTDALEATLTEQTGGVAATLVGGNSDQALIGFNFSTNGSQTISALNLSLNINTSGILSGFQLIESATASYTGAGTPVGSVLVTPGATTTVAITSLTASSTSYYFLIADVASTVADGSVTTTLNSATANQGSAIGTPFNQAATIAALRLSVTPIIASPVVAGANPVILEAGTNQVLTGFSVTSNGTQVLNTINFNLGGVASQFSDISLYRSTDGSLGSSLITADADGTFDLSAVAAGNKTISSTTVYYFLRVTVHGNADNASATVAVAPTDVNIIPASGSVNAFAINRTFDFRPSQTTAITVNYIGQGSLIETEYDDQTMPGVNNLTEANSQRLFAITITDSDSDTQPTTINSLTLQIGNATNLNGIALFDFNGATYTNISGTERSVSTSIVGNQITFSGLSINVADQGNKTIAVFVTFASPVTDNAEISMQLVAATADNANSGIATFTNIRTTPGQNVIDIDADRMTFGTTPLATPDSPFDWPVYATDANGYIDTDYSSGSVTLSKQSGPGAFSGSPTTRSFVAGVASGFAVEVDGAGEYQIKADHSGSFSDIFGDIDIISLGVLITSAPANQNFCFGGIFTTLSTIVLSESDEGDFVSAGTSDQSFSLILPPGFVFNQSVTPTPTETGSDISNLTAVTYPASNIVRFTYRSGGKTTLDAITIAGLEVKYTGVAAVSNQPILRIGGSAGQLGNTVDDNEPHGTLSAASSGTSISFSVSAMTGDPAIDANETRFSVNTNAINLIGNPANASSKFMGNGVSFVPTTSSYVFSPSSVGEGNNYQVTYLYTEPSGQQCVVSHTTTFQVYASVINNLATTYCTNSTPSTNLNVPASQIEARYGTTAVFENFVFYNRNTLQYEPIGPVNNTFDPSAPQYASSISFYGGVYIYYKWKNTATSIVNYGEGGFIKVNVAPTVTFSIPKTSFCADETPVSLIGSPANSNTVANDFFSAPGQQPSISSGGSPVSWTFSPASVTGVTASTSQTFNITYTYKDPSTNCANVSAPVAITVNPRPDAVSALSISPGTSTTICAGQTPITYTGASVLGTTYRWYGNTPPSPSNEVNAPGNSFTPNAPEFDVNTPGSTNFYVTRTIKGCESPVLQLTSVVDAPATVEAGLGNTTICAGSAVTFSTFSTPPSIGGSASSAEWSSSGTGEFRDVNDVTTNVFGVATKYIPSSTDIQAGSVKLFLTTNDPGGVAGPCTAAIDFVEITINPVAVVNPGTNQTVCAGEPIFLSGSVTGGGTSGTWSITGTPSPQGTIVAPGNLLTNYSPDPADEGRSFTVTLTSNDPSGPCGAVAANFTLNINQRPTVNAGNDFTICEGSNLTLANLTGAGIGASATSATWSLASGGAGSGDFQDNSNAANFAFNQATKYIPSATDIAFGAVTLRLTTNDPIGPCAAAEDDVLVTINPGPIVTAPSDFTVCAGNAIQLVGSRSGSASSATWTTPNGQGSITNATSAVAQYNPSLTELATGAGITLVLTSNDPDGAGPCQVATDNVLVTINQKPEVNVGLDQTLCADETINISATLIGSASSGSWSGGAGSFVSGSSLATQYNLGGTEPDGNIDVVLTFTTNDSDGTGPCEAGKDDIMIRVKPVPNSPTINPNISPNLIEYCVNAEIKPLVANGAPGSTIRWYNDAAISNLAGTGLTGSDFSSGVSNTTASQKTFYATQTVNGCESNVPAASVTIVVNPLPVPNFTMSNFCLGVGNGVSFTDDSDIPSGTIEKWGWRFGDTNELTAGSGPVTAGTHEGKTTGSYDKPFHAYSQLSNYTAELTAVSAKGCEAKTVKTLRIGAVPEANFTFEKVCHDDVTKYTYTGTIPAQLNTYEWNFGDPASGANNTSSQSGPTHTFSAVGTFNVSLRVVSDLGCENMIARNTSILPMITSFPYQQDFENTNHGWVAEGIRLTTTGTETFTSWQYNTPNGAVIDQAYDGSKAWFTRVDALNTYSNSERSVLNGPCFTLNLERPVLSFQYWNNTDTGNDGVYVEVSVDNGNSWHTLGDLASGQNWYNRAAILGLSKQAGIGQDVSQLGWSGNTWDADEVDGWTSARFNLDGFKNQAKLRLRFVLGSNGDNPTDRTLDGFAMDAFAIESRNRTILVENFTNLSSASARVNNDAYHGFVDDYTTSELVSIQYHTSIGGADPIFETNKVDANARAAYYGLTSSFRGYIDGRTTGSFSDFPAPNPALPFRTYFDSRSLVTSPLTINIDQPVVDENSMFTVHASLTTLKDIDPATQPVVHVAIVEKQVGQEYFVLRKLLPTAAGTPLTALTFDETTSTGTIQHVNVSYDLRNVQDKSKVAVIVFVQELQGERSVLQSRIFDNIPTPDVVTSTGEDPNTSFNVYPNPADREMTIELPEAATQRTTLRMYDQLGKVVEESIYEVGDSKKTIATESLAGGVYVIQIETSKGILRRKVMVTHRN